MYIYTLRDKFYNSQAMSWEHEQMFYNTLKTKPITIEFEYNLAGHYDILALRRRFNIGPWTLCHTSLKENPPSEQITIHNRDLWSCICDDRRYYSDLPYSNNYLIPYYTAIERMVQQDTIKKRKTEIFEQCAEGISLVGLTRKECEQQIILLKTMFDEKMSDFGRYF